MRILAIAWLLYHAVDAVDERAKKTRGSLLTARGEIKRPGEPSAQANRGVSISLQELLFFAITRPYRR